jgi:ABC-type transport system involved in multi-copper enzyme maturation permease subunit
MRQFFAILKDSFREAVDGFVIYAMLGMSAVVILIVASMSFTPAPADKAFPTIVKDFNRFFPEKGRARGMVFSNAEFKVENVTAAGGGYKLRLVSPAKPTAGTITENGVTRNDMSRGDSFRTVVAAWARGAGKVQEVNVGGKKIELGGDAKATPEEQQAVTDATMEEFVQNQFAMNAGMDATAKRLTGAEFAEPTYAFDVTTTGGSSVRGWPHTTKIFFGSVTVSSDTSLGRVMYIIQDVIINGLGAALALLIGLIITAFFIPNMLRKGSIDLLVSKPIGRTQLLLYKYVGGLTFVFLVTTFCVGGIWLVMALRSGFWGVQFLAVIPILTFTFAIVYAVSTLMAVLTRSPIAAMIVSVGFMMFLYIVGQVKTIFDGIRSEGNSDRMPNWAFTLVDTLNNVLPRYKDLDKLTSKLIADGSLTPSEFRMFGLAGIQLPTWTATFGVSLAFIALMLALACWRFRRRDY